jgi:membrane fusion protein (multidrug efflux system)
MIVAAGAALLAPLVSCAPAAAPVVSVAPLEVPVEVALVGPSEIDDVWAFQGTVRAREQARLAAGASGEVRAVAVDEGDAVEPGDLLLEIDAALVKARMEAARAKQAAAGAEAAAWRVLRDKAAAVGGPTAGVEAARAEAQAQVAEAQGRVARAEVETLSVELVRHELRAPFRGVVAVRRPNVGDFVYAGDPQFELVGLGEVEVLVDVPASALGDVEPGGSATLSGRDVVLGEVMAVVPAVDARTGTVRVRIKPNEPRAWLVPGAAAAVQLPGVVATEGVSVPKAALHDRGGQPTVVRVARSRAMPTPVRVLAEAGPTALVVGELREGESVVVRGADRLVAGMIVTVED